MHLVYLLSALFFLSPSMGRCAQDNRTETVFIIPIKDMIERALVYVVHRGIEEAEAAGATAIVFDMDTPGGRLDATEEIIDMISDLQVPTYTFVNNNAISAGAIIAMATDHIYMAPGGRIGDALPILMSPLPFGAPQEVPEGLKEKMISPTVALIRSAAQRNGHDPDLAEAMVRPEFEYKVGDTMVCPKGQILTLTSKDAAQELAGPGKPLLSEGTVNSLDELLSKIEKNHCTVKTLKVAVSERLARIIEGFPVSGILLALGLLGLYVEFKTPGFGFPGIAGISLMALWFWGHHVAGLAGMGEVLLFVLGLALLFVEIFLLPGFGVAGITGIVLITAALLMAMVEHQPHLPWYMSSGSHSMQAAIITLSSALTLAFLAAILLARFLPETRFFHRLALDATEDPAAGYRASENTSDLLGKVGVAATALHPAGLGSFEGQSVDVVTGGQFIAKGSSIRIVEALGNRIIVEEIHSTQKV